MFLFIDYLGVNKFEAYLFKYISCSYLSKVGGNVVPLNKYLNTSHVLIYRIFGRILISQLIYLNTSHVLIYHYFMFTEETFASDLNTSHVLIYPAQSCQKHYS